MRPAVDSREEEAHHSVLEVVGDHSNVIGGHYVECQAADELSQSSRSVGQHTNIPILTCAFMAALTTGATSYSFGACIDSLLDSYPSIPILTRH
jgi:hypothetical protein